MTKILIIHHYITVPRLKHTESKKNFNKGLVGIFWGKFAKTKN